VNIASLAVGGFVIALAAGCASPPRPTAEAVRRSRNPTAIVEGTVRDPAGKPVPKVSVQALPRNENLLWSDAVLTDSEGRFRLSVSAPGEYGFLVTSGRITVLTPRTDDPSRTIVSLRPGERRSGIELVFRRENEDNALRSPR
jgi:hypothetical protein